MERSAETTVAAASAETAPKARFATRSGYVSRPPASRPRIAPETSSAPTMSDFAWIVSVLRTVQKGKPAAPTTNATRLSPVRPTRTARNMTWSVTREPEYASNALKPQTAPTRSTAKAATASQTCAWPERRSATARWCKSALKTAVPGRWAKSVVRAGTARMAPAWNKSARPVRPSVRERSQHRAMRRGHFPRRTALLRVCTALTVRAWRRSANQALSSARMTPRPPNAPTTGWTSRLKPARPSTTVGMGSVCRGSARPEKSTAMATRPSLATRPEAQSSPRWIAQPQTRSALRVNA